jgi:hypothetical protein
VGIEAAAEGLLGRAVVVRVRVATHNAGCRLGEHHHAVPGTRHAPCVGAVPPRAGHPAGRRADRGADGGANRSTTRRDAARLPAAVQATRGRRLGRLSARHLTAGLQPGRTTGSFLAGHRRCEASVACSDPPGGQGHQARAEACSSREENLGRSRSTRAGAPDPESRTGPRPRAARARRRAARRGRDRGSRAR